MNGEQQNAERTPAEGDPTVYCVIPPELADLRESLSDHFANDPTVQVIVERRRAERRAERRAARAEGERRDGDDRDRRAALLPAEKPITLPSEAGEYADQITFVERVRSVPSGIIDRVRRLASGQRAAAAWRERARRAEQEAGELARALIGVSEDLREGGKLSPRAYAATKRADQAIERYRESH